MADYTEGSIFRKPAPDFVSRTASEIPNKCATQVERKDSSAVEDAYHEAADRVEGVVKHLGCVADRMWGGEPLCNEDGCSPTTSNSLADTAIIRIHVAGDRLGRALKELEHQARRFERLA